MNFSHDTHRAIGTVSSRLAASPPARESTSPAARHPASPPASHRIRAVFRVYIVGITKALPSRTPLGQRWVMVFIWV